MFFQFLRVFEEFNTQFAEFQASGRISSQAMEGIDPDVLLEWLQTGIGDERDLQVRQKLK